MFKKSRKFRELWIEDKEIATVKLADDFVADARFAVDDAHRLASGTCRSVGF